MDSGISCCLDEWKAFLSRKMNGALAAPKELFKKVFFDNFFFKVCLGDTGFQCIFTIKFNVLIISQEEYS